MLVDVLVFKAEREATWDKVVPFLFMAGGGEKAVLGGLYVFGILLLKPLGTLGYIKKGLE